MTWDIWAWPDRCGFRCVSWQYASGYHENGCATGVYISWPYFSSYLYGDDPVKKAEYESTVADVERRRAVVPEHIDMACDRCHAEWATGLVPEVTA